MKKVGFIASSGGHLEQIMMLKPLMNKYDSFIVTEATDYHFASKEEKVYYLRQINRQEKKFFFNAIVNTFKSFKIYFIEKPDIVISTGALATIPICLIAKIYKKKLIFIESFAKINSPTLTGKFLYKYADQFYIQWEEMQEFYPNAIYKGGIY